MIKQGIENTRNRTLIAFNAAMSCCMLLIIPSVDSLNVTSVLNIDAAHPLTTSSFSSKSVSLTYEHMKYFLLIYMKTENATVM